MPRDIPVQNDGGAQAPPVSSPSPGALKWLIGLRLLVISTLFLGVLVIQARTTSILPLSGFYGLFLFTYGLSLAYLILHLRRISTRIQVFVQLFGDIGIITGLVYATGGLYSPFSFLYLTVIVEASVFLRRWGYIFAGLSAAAYGVLVDLMFFDVLPTTPTLVGTTVPSNSRVLNQLTVNVVGFILLAFLVTRLVESHRRLEVETERAAQFVALTDHVVRSVSSGILAADTDGHVLHLNPAGAAILGVEDPDRVIGLELHEVIALPSDAWAQLQHRARHRPTRYDKPLSHRGVRLGLTVGPLQDEHGRAVGSVVNFQDRSEVERETERQRMQERMAAVGELAARMAHEIKNPLASISGSAQMLGSSAGLDATGQRLQRILVTESQRLSTILDGFLAYTRPSQKRREHCDLAALLRDCFDLLRRSDEVTDRHELVLDVPETLAGRGDPDQLRQVFWNLARNAIQALPDGGRLEITARLEDDTAILEWRDNGIGMSDEVRKQAFEPFVTTQPGGTGLGLAVVYAAVEDHGGSVSIDSTPGEGTRVTIELPASGEAP